MDIILLERVAKLGQMGEIVRVKDGYARNFLLPQGKALRATEENRTRFETERAQLEARNLERKQEAERVSGSIDGKSYIIVRSAGETGQLYGSVATRDIADQVTADGVTVARSQVRLDRPIKMIGLHNVAISLHPEVEVTIQINVARSADEADRQAAGEDLTKRDQGFEFDEIEEEEDENAEFFEEDAAPSAEDGEEAASDAAEEETTA